MLTLNQDSCRGCLRGSQEIPATLNRLLCSSHLNPQLPPHSEDTFGLNTLNNFPSKLRMEVKKEQSFLEHMSPEWGFRAGSMEQWAPA